MKKDAGKELIKQKVEDFEKYSAVLKKKGHGETNIRSNYIDVFFEALGWNMKSHYDVVREFSQIDTSGTKRVDYAFKVNGKLKFFVEAKEASIDLVNDKDAIYQAKRYAYSTNGKAPIVILTDFEEFRVFNVLKAPDYNNTDRELMKNLSFEYTGYLDRWDLLWDTFSKEAVTAGSLETLRGKIDKNTKTMDVDFLEQITGWRETLAKTIALRNKELSVDELNEAVQRILDRLLFIRNLEDREIELENTLLDKTKKAENIYKSLIPVFNNLDNVYNGLLFKKHFSEELIIDDKTIKDIIKSICYPVSPFQFDVIEPEILGRIYEKFLGSKIRLTENHQAKIEEKMEVRKAGGVYYTPEYIVNYIVENTVGRKLNPSSTPPASPPNPPEVGFSTTEIRQSPLNPDEIKKIKIVDPACGSGSFLLGAYSYLLDYHAKWYASASLSDRKKYKSDFYTAKDGEIKVNLEKRGEILKNNIFGVDIDKEATEVAIMSLYLKMLDDGFDKGERDLFFIKGHVLPDMTNNVKCGNSLIGTDYFDGKLEIDIQEMKEIKAFDWEKEFPGIFPSTYFDGAQHKPLRDQNGQRTVSGAEPGGFDCVIGNPPYGANYGNEIKHFLSEKYELAIPIADTFLMFLKRAYFISNQNALISFIIPSTWLYMPQYCSFRKTILSQKEIIEVQLFRRPVFDKVTVETCTIISNDYKPTNNSMYNFKEILEEPSSFNYTEISILQNALLSEQESNFILSNKVDKDLFNKIKKDKVTLKDVSLTVCGLTPYRLGKGKPAQKEKIVNERSFDSDYKKDDTYRQYLMGRDFSRYSWQLEKERWISYGDWLAEPRYKAPFDDDKKIIIRQTSDKLIAHLDTNKYLSLKNVHNLRTTNESLTYEYLLALLNSKLLDWWYQKLIPEKGRVFAEVKVVNLVKLPIKLIDFDNSTEKNIHDSLVTLVEQMLQAQKDFRNTKSESDKKLYEQKISMLDKKIDDLVYKLYGLTEEEIRIVEG